MTCQLLVCFKCMSCQVIFSDIELAVDVLQYLFKRLEFIGQTEYLVQIKWDLHFDTTLWHLL